MFVLETASCFIFYFKINYEEFGKNSESELYVVCHRG